MNSILFNIVPGIIVLGFLIFVHEFGHFLMAKLVNVKVLTFSLGFGKKLWKRTWGETEYALSVFPLGGYVKLLGEGTDDEIPPEDMHRSYSNKPTYAKILIVFFGPFFNVLCAAMIFFVMLSGGSVLPKYPSGPPTNVSGVVKGSPAAEAGILPGDIITAVNGQKVAYFAEVKQFTIKAGDKPLQIQVKRNSQLIEFSVTPKEIETTDASGATVKVKIIGIEAEKSVIVRAGNIMDAVLMTPTYTYWVGEDTILALWKIITGKMSRKNVGGPLSIFQAAGITAKQGTGSFSFFIAYISLSLAIINLLPIPILDGGHIMFCIIEAVTRRKLSERFVENAQKVGLAILIAIMVFAFYNDFDRFFGLSRLFNAN
jgi:regulator of sigma E protease